MSSCGRVSVHECDKVCDLSRTADSVIHSDGRDKMCLVMSQPL